MDLSAENHGINSGDGLNLLKAASHRGLGTALVVLVLLSACAPVERRARRYQTECYLAPDQSNTLLAKWTRTPVKIAVEQGVFSTSEVAQIRAGAETWNTFFAASMGGQALDYLEAGQVRVSATPFSTLTCDPRDAAIENDVFVRSITIYKRTTWPAELNNVIAATYSCPVDGRPLRTFIDATIALNY